MKRIPISLLLLSCASCASSSATTGAVDAAASQDASVPDGAVGADAGDAGDGTSTREFDLGGDFSFAHNPNGPWRYGFTTGTTLAVAELMVDAFEADVGNVGFWHPDGNAGYYPYVAHNAGSVSTTDSSSSWAVRAGEVAMEASNGGNYSVVEFIAPQSGSYHVVASFEAIHFRLSTTDVHVRHGDVALFDANIDGYGGDPAFHAETGTNPRASYDGIVTLQANDVVAFAVGYGTNGTNFNDTTGLFAHITLLP